MSSQDFGVALAEQGGCRPRAAGTPGSSRATRTKDKVIDKFQLLSPLDLETPNFILIDLAASALIQIDPSQLTQTRYRAKLELALAAVPLPALTVPPSGQAWSQPQLAQMANFLNPDPTLAWDPQTLIDAFLHVQACLDADLNPTWSWGPPTPERPQRLPYFLLYRQLRTRGLRFRADTEPHQLVAVAGQLGQPTGLVLDSLCLKLHQLPEAALLSLWAQLPETTPGRSGDHEMPDLETAIQSSLVPSSDAAALRLSLQYHLRDISWAGQPRLEYVARKWQQPATDAYLRDLERLEPRALDPRYYFNPNLPLDIYNQIQPRTRGSESRVARYQELALASLTNGFRLGLVPGLKDFQTVVEREDLRELEPLPPLVSFGSATVGFQAHMVRELADTFTRTQSFLNPESLSGECFSKTEIESLQKLIRVALGAHPDWQRLATAVDLVQAYAQGRKREAAELSRLWFSSGTEIQSGIRNCFDALMTLALLMRGWQDQPIGGLAGLDISLWRQPGQALPISVVPTSNPDIVSIYATRGFAQFKKIRAGLPPELVTRLLALPLLRYVQGEYQPPNNPNYGLTLGERLRIVKTGEGEDNVHACIRTSSNWLVTSVYYYLTVIGEPPSFEIGTLRQIQ